MRKEWFIFLTIIVSSVIIVSFFVIFSLLITDKTITGETITGEATDASLTVTISITGPPSLTIIKPLNQTYFENESLRLRITTNTNDMWYNLDNGANVTFVDETLFNTSEGDHTIYVFTNNSFGTTTKNITFNVDDSLYEIIHENYRGENKGNSTNFNEFSFNEIQNLNDIILEDILYGRIDFNEAINVTNDVNIADSETNLDNNTNISFNRIELDPIALLNFDKNSTLYLYNLTFSNPRILRDGSICASNICTIESYSGGTLKFTVTGFTVYSAEETPIDELVVPPPSGGGGGIFKGFSVSDEEIKISLKQGQTKSENITITNDGTQGLNLEVLNPDLGDLVIISDLEFYLNPGESKIIILDYIVRENILPGLYLGKIIIKSGEIEKEIFNIIEIESADALFDIEIEIPLEFLNIKPGDILPVEVSIFNIQGLKSVNVQIIYQIKNFENEILLEEKELFTVEEQKNFIRNFEIPNNAKEGKYVLYTTIIYEGKIASSTAQFSIISPLVRNIMISLFLIILIIILIIVIYEVEKHWHKD